MLPENLRDRAVASAVADFDADAVTGGKFDRGELTLEIAPGKIASVCGFLKYDQKFVRLSTVTAVDRYPAEPRFEVVYHLHSVERNERVRLKCRLRGADPVIESVTGVWRGANWYEREVFDLFGIRFINHPDLRRILMPDDWEGHPLRKDYPVTGSRI
jgi:NADH-quinone oxidoreductase subunit C